MKDCNGVDRASSSKNEITLDLSEEPSTKTVCQALLQGGYTVPDSIVDEELWICYRSEEVGDGELRKVPKAPCVFGDELRSIDPTSLENTVTYYQARNAIKEAKGNLGIHDSLSGVGIVFHGSNNLVGIDLDHVYNHRTGDVDKWALDLVQELNSYTEISPSRTGLHILVEGELDESFQNRNDDIGLEIYQADRFFTFTGQTLKETPDEIRERTREVLQVQRAWLGESETRSDPITELSSPAEWDQELTGNDEEKLRDAKESSDDMFNQLWQGNNSQYSDDHSRADLALACKLAYWCESDASQMDRLFRRSGLMRAKWDEDRGSTTYGHMTINEAILRNGH